LCYKDYSPLLLKGFASGYNKDGKKGDFVILLGEVRKGDAENRKEKSQARGPD
jgi:hypothetical protein